MYIEKDGLLIRNARPQDSEQLAAWWNDGRVMTPVGFPDGLGIDAQKVRVQLEKDDGINMQHLILEADGQPVGEMNYRSAGEGIMEIGIKVCVPELQNHGIGQKALRMLLHGLFESGTKKIVLDTDLENVRAQHVYEKTGFRRLRVNRDSWVDQTGRKRSSVDYELLPEDLAAAESAEMKD